LEEDKKRNMQEIKFAVADDAELISKLVNSGYRGDYSRQGWTSEVDLLDGTRIDAEGVREAIHRPETIILKYLLDDHIVGCVELTVSQDKMYLGMLTVEPQLQAKGIGRSLIQYAEKLAQEKKLSAIFMTVISDRKELIAWYNRLGFLFTGEIRPFDANDPVFGIPKKKLEFVVLEKKI
jgi:ribosomal protein S18 acetylase RimI-like enzyme